MRGQVVTVRRPAYGGIGADGEIESAWTEERIADVLIAAGATNDAMEANRPDGTVVAYTLAFPRSYKESLRGALVEFGGESFAVVGDPRPHPANCPTRWNRTVEVTRADG